MDTTNLFHKLLVSIAEQSDYENFLEFLTRKHIATVSSAELFGDELFRFLFLKSCYSDISPSPTVDRCWHCLLLMPVLYKRVCKLLLSHEYAQPCAEDIIAHNPLGGDNKVARNRRYAKCLAHYEVHFVDGPLLPRLWPKEYDGAVPADNEDAVGSKRQRIAYDQGVASGSGDVDVIGENDTANGGGSDAGLDYLNRENQVDDTGNSDAEVSGDDAGLSPVPETLPAPLPQAFVTVTVRNPRGFEMLYKVRTTTPLNKIFTAFADTNGVLVERLRFSYNGRNVAGDSTAFSLRMNDAPVLQVQLLPMPPAANAELPVTIMLRALGGSVVPFTIKYNTPLREVCQDYADQFGMDMRDVYFLYDGVGIDSSAELIEPTAATLEMEDGSVIDVMVRLKGC